MRINEIEIFRTLMSAGSARKAGTLIGLSQPAVSKAIQRLEKEAGFPLFQRLRGRLHPTPEAEALMEDVSRMFIGLSAIEHRIKTLREFGVGTLQIASNPAFGMGLLPRAIGRMEASTPGGRLPKVSLQILASREVRDRVAAGHFDFGLMADEISTDGLECSDLAKQPGVVVMKEGHPLARHRTIRARQLAEVPFVALNPEDSSRRRLESRLAEQGVSLSVAIHAPYAVNVCEMVLAGLGIGVVNPITAYEYSSRGLVFRKLDLDAEVICILAIPAGKILSGSARELLTALRMQLAHEEQLAQKYLRAV